MTWIESEVAAEVGHINRKIVARAVRGTVIMRNAAFQVLGQDGTGRRYKNGHVASSPGSPPASDTGNLRRNWREQSFVQANGFGHGVDVKLRLTSDVPYQVYLEQGTSKMAARPHVERIKQKALPEIQALFSGV